MVLTRGPPYIANNLLNRYERADTQTPSNSKERYEPVLIGLCLLRLLSEKRYQYENSLVEFSHDSSPEANFTFINTESSAFNRMISNLINNAVDALDGKEGKVEIKLDLIGTDARVVIRDNGKGMPPEVLDKIKNKIQVTSEKKDGHGIGFSQIHDTLDASQGQIAIESQVGRGTQITLTFPTVSPPEWMVQEIELNKGDTIIVLDDDDSIHDAWDIRFKKYGNDLSLQHFTVGEEAIDFINNFPAKDQIFLLADFELLNQGLNGLDVISRAKIERSVLVTSHYNNLKVRELAIKNGIKILPKALAQMVRIEFNTTKWNGDKRSDKKTMKKVDLVFH